MEKHSKESVPMAETVDEETASMETDSMFEEDVCSQASTVRHGNVERKVEVRRLPSEIIIPGATSLAYGETGSRRSTSVEVPSVFRLEKIPMTTSSRSPDALPDDPKKGLYYMSQCDPMSGLARDDTSRVVDKGAVPPKPSSDNPVAAQIARENRKE